MVPHLKDQPGLRFHRRAEFKPRADRVGHVQGTLLVRHFDELCRQLIFLEVRLEGVEISVRLYAHTKAHTARHIGFSQRQTVVASLLQPAEVKGVVLLRRHHKAHHVTVKNSADGKVAHTEDSVACARDIEEGI